MTSTVANLVILLLSGGIAAGLSLLARRRWPGAPDGVADTGPASATLSYVATAFGVVIGFSTLFLFSEVSSARQAIGDEATSIGTAFEEAGVFGAEGVEVQAALICYAQAVSTYEWPAMRNHTSAPEADAAYADLVASLGSVGDPPAGALIGATATNLVAQIGGISTAREARIVTATTPLPTMLLALMVGGSLLVLCLMWVITRPASPLGQAVLVGSAATFTAVLVLLVLVLSSPFADGSGRLNPELIEGTAASMVAASPDAAALGCP